MKIQALRFAFRHSGILLLGSTILLIFAGAGSPRAESRPFDLAGPTLEVKVTRGAKTLPISSISSLQTGDRIWVHANLPSDQSAHYVLIAAFLQGPTNPPPENWFTKIETWNKDVREEGSFVTVPQNAEEALLFLAPDASGMFNALRATVRGKPGAFVRATQDLQQSSLDRTRIDKFLEEIEEPSVASVTPLTQRVALLSRTLSVKADPDCFNKPMDEQQSCLTQDTGALVLDDPQNQSMVATLTSGPSADLAGNLGSTPVARSGYYSPYIGSALDIARLLNNFHTADLRYLPALTTPKQEDLYLKLNAPPSFIKPQSVLVVGLPLVKETNLPSLHPADANQIFCLQNPLLVLPAVGTPLVYSTNIAHDFVLHLQSKSGTGVDLPAKADAGRGGFTVDAHKLNPDDLDAQVTGTLRGSWGFDTYVGPSFRFRNAHSAQWNVPSTDASALLAGRKDTLHLQSSCAPCVEKVSAQDAQGKSVQPDWKLLHSDEVEVTMALKDESVGPVKVMVQQFGVASPDVVTLRAYSEASHLDGFKIYAGDKQGILTGARLDQVESFELSGIHFAVGKVDQSEHQEALRLEAPNAAVVAALTPGEHLVAHVQLKDGRKLELQTAVDSPRPIVTLTGKTVKRGSLSSGIHLGNPDELPQNGQLSFLLKAQVPDKFPRKEQIEVATTDGASETMLSVASGNLILQDSENALAVLDPLKNLGSSAFGPLQFRPVDGDGAKGDWLPLATLVRIPSLSDIRCPADADKPCVLSGSNLFLLDAVASDGQFKNSVPVPVGYSDTTLSVPRPNGTLLFLKLRDDPSTVDTVTLPVFPADQ
jgi:hypothetical protein